MLKKGIEDIIRLLYITILLLGFIQCSNNKTHLTDIGDTANGYVLKHKEVSLYDIQYNSNNKPIKIIDSRKKLSSDREDASIEEHIYYYDSRDSLAKIQIYFVIDKKKKYLYSEEIYSDDEIKLTHYFDYPKDTTSFSYRKLDRHKNIIKEYYKPYRPSPYLEKEVTFEYDNEGLLVKTIEFNIFDNSKTIRTYTYENKEDTLFRTSYKNDSLSTIRKEYSKGKSKVEVVKYISGYQIDIDSTFTSKNQIKTVAYNQGLKTIETIELDQFGNWIRNEVQTWELKNEITNSYPF